jgi:D-amino-acid dehydrogenase
LSKRVVIIGGGIVGLCSGYYLNARGYQVTLIERNGPERDACSYGNAGIIVPSHFVPLAAPGMVALGLRCMWNPESPFYVKPRLSSRLLSWSWKFWKACTPQRVNAAAPVLRDLNMASRAAYEELTRELGEEVFFSKNGLLILCKTAHAFEEESGVAEHAKTLGMPVEVLDASQAAAREPNIRMSILGAIHYPLDCHLAPGRMMHALQSRLTASNIDFRWNTTIDHFRKNGSRLVAVESGGNSFEADEFVLCAGVWSDDMARELNLSLPMQPGKGYSLTLPNPPQQLNSPAILLEARVAVTPMGPSLRFGGTMELAGIETKINPSRIRGIVKSAPQYFPDFNESHFAGVEPWCGLRPCSPDGLPYLGRSRKIENLTIATGHAMMGLSLGPISGQIVADAIDGKGSAIDLTLVSPDRYA